MADVEAFSTPVVYDAASLMADVDDAGVDEAIALGYPLPGYRDDR